ncbi:MAG: resuscitation-promoting factor RpfB [Chloroflexota bacterium]|jgi:hypothetical protein|nr:resuscitation-promoting factor RpfB [Chloroflexota bacterium]
MLRRIVLLSVISVAGVALLAPLAARSATPLPLEIAATLLPLTDAPQIAIDRGGLSNRQGAILVAAGSQAAEELHASAVPTPAAAPMEATLHDIAAPAAPARAPQRVVTYAGTTVWDDLARCESSGNWAINTGNGYYGGLQFSLGTWQQYGGAEFAAYPHQATRAEQIAVAERLRAARGYAPWPACRAKLGLP